MSERDVEMVEAPGGLGLYGQCPYCSRMHPTADERGRPVELPARCVRCSAPMDYERARAFGDQAAALAVAGPQRDRMQRRRQRTTKELVGAVATDASE